MNSTSANSRTSSSEGWWRKSLFHDFCVAMLTGVFVTAGSIIYQSHLDDKRQSLADSREDSRQLNAARQENLRFVREHSSLSHMERPFSAIDLEGQNVAGLLLDQANFSQSNLKSAEFMGTRVREGNFHQADLTSADMTGGDFGGALFLHSKLPGANLSYSDLSGAQFYGGSLVGADLSASDLGKVVFTDTVLDGAYLVNADLRGADLSRTSLDWVTMHPRTYISDGLGMLKISQERVFEGICYDTRTKWPVEFEPPQSNIDLCRQWDSPDGLADISLWAPPNASLWDLLLQW